MSTDFRNALSGLVELYSSKYRHPDLPPLVVLEPHTMTSWYGKAEAAKPGCYVFFSAKGEPLYVGKASLTRHVGQRVAAHDYQRPRAHWRERAAFLIFISVSQPFEAPSLEEFLIGQMRPIGNVRGGGLVTADLAAEASPQQGSEGAGDDAQEQ